MRATSRYASLATYASRTPTLHPQRSRSACTSTMKITLPSGAACFINVPYIRERHGRACRVLNVLLSFVCRGFGFITFADPASVDKVLAQGNHELDGKKVSNPFAFYRINSNNLARPLIKVGIFDFSVKALQTSCSSAHNFIYPA